MVNRVSFFIPLVLAVLAMGGCGKNITPSTPSTGSSNPSYTFLFNYGDANYAGTGNGQFNGPYGVAVYNGWIFATDLGGRVQKFDLNGNFIWASTGNPSKHFVGPEGIAISKNGLLYVTDDGNNQVQVLDVNGNYLTSLGYGTGTNQLGDFLNPLSIAVDSQSNIYVTDHGNERLEKCDSNGTNCVTVTGFTYIAGVATDSSDNVWVTDETVSHVTRYSSSLGSPYALPVSVGTNAGQIYYPRGITVGPDGNLYICNYGRYLVDKFTTSGQYLGSIGTPGPGAGPGQFEMPNFLAVDSSLNAYASDFDNQTVSKFGLQ